MNFADFVKTQDRRCKLCRFFEANPKVAKEIRSEVQSNKAATGTVIAKYLIEQHELAITSANVTDHFRRGHEGKAQ